MRIVPYLALVLFAAGGCLPRGPAEHVSRKGSARLRRRAGRALQAGIAAYNDGRTAKAREHLESALKGTSESSLSRIRAEAHFYLAAVAWDLGEKVRTTYHLKLCRHVDPTYTPTDWTFISPGLRRRFESLE